MELEGMRQMMDKLFSKHCTLKVTLYPVGEDLPLFSGEEADKRWRDCKVSWPDHTQYMEHIASNWPLFVSWPVQLGITGGHIEHIEESLTSVHFSHLVSCFRSGHCVCRKRRQFARNNYRNTDRGPTRGPVWIQIWSVYCGCCNNKNVLEYWIFILMYFSHIIESENFWKHKAILLREAFVGT
mgnify:CR=1 FL=1